GQIFEVALPPNDVRSRYLLFGDFDHRSVLIHCDQCPTKLNALPNQCRMPPDANRGIDDDLPRPRIEPVKHLTRQHRDVFCFIHFASPGGEVLRAPGMAPRIPGARSTSPLGFSPSTKKRESKEGFLTLTLSDNEPQIDCGLCSRGCRQTLIG